MLDELRVSSSLAAVDGRYVPGRHGNVSREVVPVEPSEGKESVRAEGEARGVAVDQSDRDRAPSVRGGDLPAASAVCRIEPFDREAACNRRQVGHATEGRPPGEQAVGAGGACDARHAFGPTAVPVFVVDDRVDAGLSSDGERRGEDSKRGGQKELHYGLSAWCTSCLVGECFMSLLRSELLLRLFIRRVRASVSAFQIRAPSSHVLGRAAIELAQQRPVCLALRCSTLLVFQL